MWVSESKDNVDTMPNDKKTVSKTAAPLKSIIKEASLHAFGCVGDTLQLEAENPCSSEWTLYVGH